jgi:hypothetical protein
VSTTESELLQDTELSRVVDWRMGKLLSAGYEQRDARRIAERIEVDLHRAIELLRSGCPAETAVRILL